MGDAEAMIGIEIKVENYLKERFGPDAHLISMERIGEGVHGGAYLLKWAKGRVETRLIVKSLFPSGFGHDHYSDRAQVLLLAHANYNDMPKHVKAVDVLGESPVRLISLKDAREFYMIMEEAEGESYFEDLDAILKRGSLSELDMERAKRLALFLYDIHRLRYDGDAAQVLYRRRIRDLIGHGECIMGIIDAYGRTEFTTDRELTDYARKCLSWWGKIRNRSERLCRVHGDYHPGNIWFQGDDFTVLDRSRGSWGEAACDAACLGINYVYYAIKERGTCEGPFAELFRLFLKTYLEKTEDDAFFEVAQPFFAFRVLVLAHPRFYPGDTPKTKRKLLNFGHSLLETQKFDPEKVTDYLEEEWASVYG